VIVPLTAITYISPVTGRLRCSAPTLIRFPAGPVVAATPGIGEEFIHCVADRPRVASG
jgi:hypothetical protein